MSEQVDIPDLERITFFPGQRLTAPDLSELRRVHQELRWLHNRSLHMWGVGIGLAVTGERGDSAVTIAPGYGTDCLGREILLTEARMKTVPAVASGPSGGEAIYYLVARYLGDEGQKLAERRPGVCLPEGTVRLSEEPLIEWRRPEQLQQGLELILAQAWIKNCQLSRPLSFAARRSARPSQQPYIAAGQTPQGNTAWTAWQVGNNHQTIGILAHVSTSAARFHATPRYVAHVAGERYLDPAPGPLLLLGATEVVNATPDGFTMQVQLPNFPGNNPPINPGWLLDSSTGVPRVVGIVKQLGWHVVWMGIES
jgi:hypothetical protein